MTDMRAVCFTEFGDPSVLHVRVVPLPSPGPGQVRVRVAAATVNPTDIGFRLGGRDRAVRDPARDARGAGGDRRRETGR